ncbi:MAG: ATP-dependent RecD-like DNA helicase, partial [Planctomycetes bacterium]|nr:ATP-dependent RecD-like DNA helicase [Planctomycetota bacterium]
MPIDSEAQVVEGLVVRLIFRNEDTGFAIARLETSDGELTAAGLLGDVEPEDRLRLVGDYEVHPRFGRQFKARTCQRLTPATLAGIERYLAGPRVEGIGPELARRLVAAFGERT